MLTIHFQALNFKANVKLKEYAKKRIQKLLLFNKQIIEVFIFTKLENNSDRNNKEAYASSYIYNIKNLNSYELITDTIDKINFNKKDYKITFYEKIKYMLPFKLYNFTSKIKYNFTSKIEFRRFKRDLTNSSKCGYLLEIYIKISSYRKTTWSTRSIRTLSEGI